MNRLISISIFFLLFSLTSRASKISCPSEHLVLPFAHHSPLGFSGHEFISRIYGKSPEFSWAHTDTPIPAEFSLAPTDDTVTVIRDFDAHGDHCDLRQQKMYINVIFSIKTNDVQNVNAQFHTILEVSGIDRGSLNLAISEISDYQGLPLPFSDEISPITHLRFIINKDGYHGEISRSFSLLNDENVLEHWDGLVVAFIGQWWLHPHEGKR